MKFNKGDYICYAPENEQEVIDGLLGYGQKLHSKEVKGEEFSVFVFSVFEHDAWARALYFDDEICKNNITSVFVTNIRSKKHPKKPDLDYLPDLFYIDCGDKKEVREWLDGLGFKWFDCESLVSCGLNSVTVFLIEKESMKVSPLDVVPYLHTKVTPVTGKTQIDAVTDFNVEPNESKELSELKKAYEELGEKIRNMESK